MTVLALLEDGNMAITQQGKSMYKVDPICLLRGPFRLVLFD